MTFDIDALVGGDWVYVGGATDEMMEAEQVPGGVFEIMLEMDADAWRYRDGTSIEKRCRMDSADGDTRTERTER